MPRGNAAPARTSLGRGAAMPVIAGGPPVISRYISVVGAVPGPMPGRSPALPRLVVRDLYRFRPQGDVGGDHGREFFRAAAEWIDAVLGEPFDDLGILDPERNFPGELVDNLLGRAGGSHQAVPGQRLEAG